MDAIDVAALARDAGFAPDLPLSVAARGPGVSLSEAFGRWPSGAAVSRDDRFYAASLSKQSTGVAVALLVREGRLDPDAEISATYVPRWPTRPTARQLLHHIGGMPPAGVLEAALDQHWTHAFALKALAATSAPASAPGSAYAYSNAGYIVLARVVERAAGQPFPTFVATRIFAPLGLSAMAIVDDAAMLASPQVPALGPILALSTGDGGLWTTAKDFATWLDAQNRDGLGVADLVTANARLLSGDPVDYGWGIGLRAFREHPLFIHGGSWTGARGRALRCPALGLSVVAFASTDRDEPIARLTDLLLNALAGAT